MKIKTAFRYLFPLWLLGILIGPNLTAETNSVVQMAAIMWFSFAGILLGGSRFLIAPTFSQHPIVPICLGTFLLVALPASVLISMAPAASVGFWVTTLVAVITCAGLWGLLDNEDISVGLRAYAIIGIPALALLFLPGYTVDLELLITGEGSERLGYLRNPNSIGMIMMGFLLCTVLIRSRSIKVPLLLLGSVILVLTLSRSAIFATLIATAVLTGFSWRQFSTRVKSGLVTAALLSFGLIAVLYGGIVIEIVDKATGLSDPTRGWGNFTNRADAWIETLNLWAKHPLLGVGYRAHEPHLTTLSSAHNGYLALLAETGIIGTIPMMVFLISSGLRVLQAARTGSRVAQIGFALLCAMAFISFFERSLINFGNPSSILQLVFLMMPGSRKVTSA
jgi:O-antigen ligase